MIVGKYGDAADAGSASMLVNGVPGRNAEVFEATYQCDYKTNLAFSIANIKFVPN